MKSCEAALWNGRVAKWRLSHRLVTSDKATKTHHPPGPRSIKIHQNPSFVFFSLVPLFRHGGMEQYDHLGRWLWWGKSIKDHKRDIMDQWHTWCKHDTFLTPCWSCYDGLKKQWTFGELHFKFLHTVSPCNLYFLHCMVLIYTQVSPLEEFYLLFRGTCCHKHATCDLFLGFPW